MPDFGTPEPPAPCLVFPSMCDPFDNHPDLAEPRRRFFNLIQATPNLTWLLLTKRPQNIVKLFDQTIGHQPGAAGAAMLEAGRAAAWPRNAAIGCTVVTQEEADRDIPHLLAAKAALNPAFAFLSMEPLLGPVDLRKLQIGHDALKLDALTGFYGATRQIVGALGSENMYRALSDMPRLPPRLPGIDWVITGGETDQGAHKARPTHPDWLRSIRDQCGAAGVPYHHKQNGEWCEFGEHGFLEDGSMNFLGKPDNAPHGWARFGEGDGCRIVTRVGKKRSGRLLDGVLHDAMPEARP